MRDMSSYRGQTKFLYYTGALNMDKRRVRLLNPIGFLMTAFILVLTPFAALVTEDSVQGLVKYLFQQEVCLW